MGGIFCALHDPNDPISVGKQEFSDTNVRYGPTELFKSILVRLKVALPSQITGVACAIVVNVSKQRKKR